MQSLRLMRQNFPAMRKSWQTPISGFVRRPAILLPALLIMMLSIMAPFKSSAQEAATTPTPSPSTSPSANIPEAAEALLGYWLDEKGKLAVDIQPCENNSKRLCGKIAWLKKTHHDDGSLRRDVKASDSSKRDAPLCGLMVVSGLKQDGKRWSGGTVYDYKSGNKYDMDIRPNSDGTVRMRAYLGVPLLGKKETWKRPPADLEMGCNLEPQL